ncbi:GGDEF domain-containing protein [Mesobacillus zeae]|uniref:GGDEF domain-containing protein n=1 Tax=Mesobacillus zeae TaxID=1917180 RepID=A0A398B624_9BACI|nr:GGDEF domain-containing protein [Mesobacillus zeae]RID84258.1 GGDEF domain-containing protein [Mesobacillus zeae]
MFKKIESLDDLKRVLYLSILPCIIAGLVAYNFLGINAQGAAGRTYILISRFLVVWYIFNWICILNRRYIRQIELLNLVMITIMHIGTVYDAFFHYILCEKDGGFGISLIWTPLIYIIIFLTLESRTGLIWSLGVLGVTLVFGIIHIPDIPPKYGSSVVLFYTANLIYIILFYLAWHIFNALSELKAAKRNASLDSLTGIANRYQIDIWLDEHLKSAMEQRAAFSIIFFDIDYFKLVNDRYGHKTGDSVLKELADLIRESLPEEAFFGRWGGEEFIIITDYTKDVSSFLAEMVRSKIEGNEFASAGKLTASFGVASYQYGEMVDRLVARADVALYESKRQGRNRVTII